MYNDELLLYTGRVWDSVDCAAPPIRVWVGSGDNNQGERKQMLKEAGLESVQDFRLLHQELREDMMFWMRVSLSTDEELQSVTAKQLYQPVTMRLEQDVYSSLLKSIEKIWSAYDHSVEEDEWKLKAKDVPSRTRLAVMHRKLSKEVLLKNVEMLAKHMEAYELHEKKNKAAKILEPQAEHPTTRKKKKKKKKRSK